MAKTKNRFTVGGLVKSWVEMEVTADSFESALEQARKLKPGDFYETTGSVVDHSLTIIGISDSASVDI